MNLAKRNLRVTKWMGAVPAVAVCRLCGPRIRGFSDRDEEGCGRASESHASIRQPQMQGRHYVRAGIREAMNLPEGETGQATIFSLWFRNSLQQAVLPLGQQAVDFGHQQQELPGILFDRSLPAKFCPALFFFHLRLDAGRSSRQPLEPAVSCRTCTLKSLGVRTGGKC